jgi:hypothetical protein
LFSFFFSISNTFCIQICTGGPVIDEDGVMVGIITCHVPEAAMMTISIVQICLDMWKNYRCVFTFCLTIESIVVM